MIHSADHRAYGVGGQSLKLRDDTAQVVGAVLAVDEQPVEAGAGNEFGTVGVGKAEEQSDLRFTGSQRTLEGILWHVHAGLPD